MRLLEDAGLRGRRWAEVLGRIDMLPPAEHDLVVRCLEALEVGALGEDDRNAVWTGLRSIVARHRTYSRANWAMSEAYVTRLDQIRERFAPSGSNRAFSWPVWEQPRVGRRWRSGRHAFEKSREASWQVHRSRRWWPFCRTRGWKA